MAEPPAADPVVPKAFETLGGHYRLVGKLGEGAFGMVYEAQHELLGQEFAVKLLKPELCEDVSVRSRFLDEARALIRFSHQNVVQLRHVGEQDGRLYLVMDLVRGEPLNEVIQRDGEMDESRAVSIALQVLAGLEAAHAAGIVHRDLKPSNIVVEKRPDGTERVRILDFGLSKLQGIDGMASAHRSVSGSIIGTLAYMSPEQLKGDRDIDGRSDVFAAGLIFHEMLQGHHPYPGESGIVVAAKLLRDPVPPLDPKKAARLQPHVRAAIAQALERDRDARFPSAFAFAQALEGRGPPSDTSQVTTIEHARQELARREAKQVAAARVESQRKRRLVAGVVGGLLLLVGGAAAALAFGLLGGGEKEPDGPGASVAQVPSPDPATPPRPSPTARPAPPVPTPAVPDPDGTPAATTPPAAPRNDPAASPATGPSGAPAPEPSVPDVAPPQAPSPDPASTQPEPEPPPPDVSPVPEPTPEPDVTPAATTDPRDDLAAGRWDVASAGFRRLLAKDPADPVALRGAAQADLAAADALARSSRVEEALLALQEIEAWLGERYAHYESQGVQERDRVRVPSGFALMLRGEAKAERTRWLRHQGQEAAAAQALEGSEADFQLAWQFLSGDGVNYWEMLIRRAEVHRLAGRWKESIEDLAITTQTDNTEVPAHMWVAHARGLRRECERLRDGGDRKAAAQAADQAKDIAKRGVSWQNKQFTQAQWLEVARVVLALEQVLPETADRNEWAALMGWYVTEAQKRPPEPWLPEGVARARMLATEAALAQIDAKVLRQRKKPDEAVQRLAQAQEAADEAVRLYEEAAAAGGPLPPAFPYEVRAFVRFAAGDTDGAKAEWARARAAAPHNPD